MRGLLIAGALAVLSGCETPERHAVQQRLNRLQAENSALKAEADAQGAQARIDAVRQQQDMVRMVEALNRRLDELAQRIDTPKAAEAKPPEKPATVPAPATERPATQPAQPPQPADASGELERIKAAARDELERLLEQLAKAQVQAEAARKASVAAQKPTPEGLKPPSWVGKTLPLTKFLDSSGKMLDLSVFTGQKCVVLTIMKGFYSGGICIYCTRQAVALARAAEAFRAAEAEVLVMYPGAEERIPDFVRSVRDSEKSDDPRFKLPFKVLLDVNQDVVRSLGIVSDLALPATYILDKAGVVRYEYIGRTISDRPSAGAVLEEVKKIGAGKP